jgi:hypothetical protein
MTYSVSLQTIPCQLSLLSMGQPLNLLEVLHVTSLLSSLPRFIRSRL